MESHEISMKWVELRLMINEKFGLKPDINGFLFLIGMNELGQVHDNWSKEQKQDLMHIAMCRLLEPEGYFRFLAKDDDGWPHYEALKEVPKLPLKEQENWLKTRIVHYFIEMESKTEQ